MGLKVMSKRLRHGEPEFHNMFCLCESLDQEERKGGVNRPKTEVKMSNNGRECAVVTGRQCVETYGDPFRLPIGMIYRCIQKFCRIGSPPFANRCNGSEGSHRKAFEYLDNKFRRKSLHRVVRAWDALP
jgi:hypothetical protein